MKTVQKVVAACLLPSLVLVAGVVHAADDGVWYIGASLANARVNSISVAKYEAQLANLNMSARSTTIKEDDVGFKLIYGYQFNKNFSLEGSYASLGTPLEFSTNITAPAPGGARKETIRIRGWGLDAVGILPLKKNFALSGKAGMYYSRAELDVMGVGARNETESKANPKFGLGVNFSLTDEFGLRAEWERYMRIGDKATTGQGDADLWSAGMTFKF